LNELPAFVQPVLDFIRAHEAWAVPIVFLLAFGESLAFISLLLPATVILWGIGALVGASGIAFFPLWLAALVGAGLGDWLSYWLGYHYHAQIARMWPLSKNPDLLPRGHAFFEKWGWAGVFFGRFLGPLRAAVPLVAGTCQMPQVPFQLANWLSAAAWATWTLGAGAFGVEWLQNGSP
jgi:membrane protein DedA with SNARE-associated domain